MTSINWNWKEWWKTSSKDQESREKKTTDVAPPAEEILRASDDPFTRAEKALRIIGLIDRSGRFRGYLAEVFMHYQRLDEAAKK